jgi:hypothetical protein
MAIYVLNAKSINMNNGAPIMTVDVPITQEEAKLIAASGEIKSLVGHPDTARVLSNLLKKEIPANRWNFTWDQVKPEDQVIVGQYSGPRLQEGATQLPEGSTLTFWKVKAFRKEEILARVNAFSWAEPGVTDNIDRADVARMVEDWFKP